MLTDLFERARVNTEAIFTRKTNRTTFNPDIESDNLAVMANVSYNQRIFKPNEFDSITNEGFQGLAGHVKKTQIYAEGLPDRFYNANPKTVAKSLCTTIARYLYNVDNFGTKAPFHEWYAAAIKAGGVGTKTKRSKNFFWVKDEILLMSFDKGRTVKYEEISRKKEKLNNRGMLDKFLELGWKSANIRLGGHTFYIRREKIKGEIKAVCYDTFHNKRTGGALALFLKFARIKYIYRYL